MVDSAAGSATTGTGCQLGCVPIQIQDWEAQCSKTFEYSGSVAFPDPCNLYGCISNEDAIALGGQRLTLTLDAFTAPVGCDNGVEACALTSCMGTPVVGAGYTHYDSEQIWLDGLTMSGGVKYEQTGMTANLNIVPITHFMSGMSVNSHHVYNMFLDPGVILLAGDSWLVGDFGAPDPPLARDVLEDLATMYADLDVGDFDFSAVPNHPICGPVNGTSILGQMQLIASAVGCDCFINEQGKLIAEPWKEPWNEEDPVELTIPNCMLVDAELAGELSVVNTRIKVLGGYRTKYDKGFRPEIIGAGTPGALGEGQGPQGVNCTLTWCPPSGADPCESLPSVITPEVTDPDLPPTGVALGSRRGEVSNFRLPMWLTNGPFANHFAGYISHSRLGLGALQNFVDSGQSVLDSMVNLTASTFARHGINPFLAKMFGGAQPFMHASPIAMRNQMSPVQDFNETDPTRMEFKLLTCDLQYLGPIDTSIDNPYIYSHEQSMRVAIRTSQEQLMGFRTWTIRVKYIPCLKINQVIEFETPPIVDQEDPTKTHSCTVRGIITSIRTAYEGSDSPSAAQTITVADYSLVGNCDYTAVQLLADHSLVGLGRFNLVEVNSGDPRVVVGNGEACFELDPGDSASLHILQPYVSGDRSYTFCLSTTASVSVAITGLGGTVSGGGTVTGINQCVPVSTAGISAGDWAAMKITLTPTTSGETCITDISLRTVFNNQ